MATSIPIARAARLLSGRARWQIRQHPSRHPSRLQHQAESQYTRNFSSTAAVVQKKYSKDHEWVDLSSDGTTATIGISIYAANALGDVVYVELPEASTEVSAGEPMGAVESVKSASDIFAPISGRVVESNAVLSETPGMLNQDPEGEEGWIAKLEVEKETVKAQMDELMDATAYKKFTED